MNAELRAPTLAQRATQIDEGSQKPSYREYDSVSPFHASTFYWSAADEHIVDNRAKNIRQQK